MINSCRKPRSRKENNNSPNLRWLDLGWVSNGKMAAINMNYCCATDTHKDQKSVNDIM